MKVPFVNLHAQYQQIAPVVEAAWQQVRSDMFFIEGKRVTTFENQFSAYLRANYCLACSHGTDALMIALSAAGVGHGDEVIVPALSWVSTATAVNRVGATPIFVDIEPSTYCIDVNHIASKISSRTKAIIPVHLYGRLADMPRILEIARKYHLFVLEDAAQAHGATLQNKMAGTWGNAAAFSFYPVKTLGAYGDAGCIVSESEDFMQKARLLAKQGQKEQRGVHYVVGFNSRMDSIQAAILSAKLPYLPQWIVQRIVHAKKYAEGLAGLPIQLPVLPKGTEHSFHLFVIRVPSYRDALKQFLAEQGIETMIHYPLSLPLQPLYQGQHWKVDDFPVSARVCSEVLSLPLYPELTEEERTYVIEQIQQFFTLLRN